MTQLQLISNEYLHINKDLHDKLPTYGVGGHRWANKILKVAAKYGVKTVLDYGCGKGTLELCLGPFIDISGYDPAVPDKNTFPVDPVHMVTITDVLEHIEPECLDNVLSHVFFLAQKVLFGTVAVRPARKFLIDGRNAHLIIQPLSWWTVKLSEYWVLTEVVENMTQQGEFFFVGVPKDVEYEAHK